jgi:thiamine-phosphate pyrophosphorylase
MENLAALRLILVTDDDWLAGRDVLEVARAAVRGGITALQLRLKRAGPRELVTLARVLRDRLEIPVLVNDRLDVALAAGAAGVHLGPDDLPVELARRIVPPGFWIGASVGSRDEIPRGRGADYWGVGPWRASATKPDAGVPIGADGFRAVVARSGGTPCVAIGGIRPEDVPLVRAAGGAGVAVISGILGAADPARAAAAYAEAGGRV